jgi:hypothetical protein
MSLDMTCPSLFASLLVKTKQKFEKSSMSKCEQASNQATERRKKGQLLLKILAGKGND